MLTGSAPPSELLWSGDARPSILDSDGNQPRRDDQAVQGLRKRMCYELTLATSALYWTARYLAYARLVQLIADVGAAFQGKGGAGIFSEQQDSVAEMMVDSDGKVLSHYEFRRRLLELPGWEQFTALFLFFISEDDQLDIEALDEPEKRRARFVAKLRYEVDATIRALARLETRLTEICGSRTR